MPKVVRISKEDMENIYVGGGSGRGVYENEFLSVSHMRYTKIGKDVSKITLRKSMSMELFFEGKIILRNMKAVIEHMTSNEVNKYLKNLIHGNFEKGVEEGRIAKLNEIRHSLGLGTTWNE